jgi:tRNA synthetases class II (D, K and N)/Type I restriction modification DNA specificity domain
LRSGKTPSTKKREYWCNHEEKCDCVNWYQGKDIIKEKLRTERRITQLAVEENKQPLTTSNSLLFFALECFPFYSGQAGASCYGGGPGVMILECQTDLIIPNYLYYCLLSRRKELKFLRGGSVQRFLTKSELENFPFLLPPLPQQKQILAKFQLVYNKIYQTEVQYQNTLLKILQKHLEIGDLLFLKHKDSEIRVGDEFRLVRGKTPPSSNYPLQKKKIPLEMVRNYPHLRAKTNYFSALFRLRHSVSKAIHDFFHQEGFYYIPTPIITSNDAEGAGELFNITTSDKEPFFPKVAKLTVSGQLQAEALAQGLGKVYTFGPCFRAEKSHTTRHLAEF